MSRIDEIFNSFLEHEIIQEKYNFRKLGNKVVGPEDGVKIVDGIRKLIKAVEIENKTDQEAIDILSKYLND